LKRHIANVEKVAYAKLPILINVAREKKIQTVMFHNRLSYTQSTEECKMLKEVAPRSLQRPPFSSRKTCIPRIINVVRYGKKQIEDWKTHTNLRVLLEFM